jgi:hypothetical protein
MGAEEKAGSREAGHQVLLNARSPTFARPDAVLSFGTVQVEN